MSAKWILILGAVLGASGVALGAYHAHGLEKQLGSQELTPDEVAKRIDQFGTGVRYQMYHALALMLVGIMACRADNRWLSASTVEIALGVVLFSGMLYRLGLTGEQFHVLLIPAGGVSYIVGWCLLAVAIARTDLCGAAGAEK